MAAAFVVSLPAGAAPGVQRAAATKPPSSLATPPKASAALPSAGWALGGAVVAAFTAASPRRRRVARRGWGDDVTFYSASVASNVEAAEGLRLISLSAAKEVSEPYQRGGQFVQAKADDEAKPSFYAISSAPGSGGDLEFLVKEADANSWITAAKAGDLLKLSPAMGKGFDVNCDAWKEAEVKQVNIFATGSGVAPMRAVIESDALKGKTCRFYYGARTESGMAYADRFDDWSKRGVELIPTLSKPQDSWSGRTGYVQDVMQEDESRGEGFVLSSSHGALLCGQKEMVEAVRKVYEELGVPQERTLLNF